MTKVRSRVALVSAAAALLGTTTTANAAAAATRTVVEYDARTAAEYAAKWSNPYGLGEVGANDTRRYRPDGSFEVSAVPFTQAADVSVFDHLKYFASSNQSFAVPADGSLTFAVDIRADTPGARPHGKVVTGCYGPSLSWPAASEPCARPWSATVLEGQQAGAVLNMINFSTGQLFDWFVSGHQAFALIERLPSTVTNPALMPGDPGYVGLDKAYTQIVEVAKVQPDKKHHVAIRYTRGATQSSVEYFLDQERVARVDNVGVPLDIQGVPFTGVYPSLGTGEPLKDELDSFVIGHGLFSLLDAFPFQHPERPDLSVSIPRSERLFGQGARGEFGRFRVTTVAK